MLWTTGPKARMGVPDKDHVHYGIQVWDPFVCDF